MQFKVPELKKLRSVSAKPSGILNGSFCCLCTLISKSPKHDMSTQVGFCVLTLAIAGALILWLLNTIIHLMLIFLQCTTKVCSWKRCANTRTYCLGINFSQFTVSTLSCILGSVSVCLTPQCQSVDFCSMFDLEFFLPHNHIIWFGNTFFFF